MLAIEATFLRHGYFGTDDSGVAPEYPPPPTRLLAGCLRACHANGFKEHEPLLRYLERAGAPVIHASRPYTDERYNNLNTKAFYVPTEPASTKQLKENPMLDRLDLLLRPGLYLREPRVIYEWPDVDLDEQQTTALDDLLNEVSYLGRSDSLVSVRQVEEPDLSGLDLSYVPAENGDMAIKTLSPGDVQSLCDAFETGSHFDHWNVTYYRMQGQTTTHRSPWKEMVPFSIRGRVHVTRALWMIEALRSVLLGIGGDGMPAAFHGHGWDETHSHVALVPLVHVDAVHADGMVKGFAVCLPNCLVSVDHIKIMRALEQLCRQGFGLRGQHLDVAPVGASPMRSLKTGRWRRSSRMWSSVTPVALDRQPKKRVSVEGIIARMCENIGLPSPQEIEYRRMPFLAGVPASHEFRLRRKGKYPIGHGHVRLLFKEAVQGPLILGNLRHFGIGLMAPHHDDQTGENHAT